LTGILNIMEEQKSVSKGVVATVSALAVTATAIGGGIAWLTMQNNDRSSSIPPRTTTIDNGGVPISPNPATPTSPLATNPNPIGSVPAPPTAINPVTPPVDGIKPNTPSIAQTEGTTIRTWGVDDDGKKTTLVPRTEKIAKVIPSNDPNSIVTESLNKLIATAGKKEGKVTSTIPVGTKLLSAEVKPDGIHINLSQDFIKSSGATSTIARLGQVVYTATSVDRSAKVWINVEGKPLEVMGDVGVEVRQPITRAEYDRDFPINPDAADRDKSLDKTTDPNPIN
jgi:spore germination protein GerM